MAKATLKKYSNFKWAVFISNCQAAVCQECSNEKPCKAHIEYEFEKAKKLALKDLGY